MKEKDCRLCFKWVSVQYVGDNSSPASAASVKSTPGVGRTSNDDNQPLACLSIEKANSSSLQDDFQISEPKVKYQNPRLNIRT